MSNQPVGLADDVSSITVTTAGTVAPVLGALAKPGTSHAIITNNTTGRVWVRFGGSGVVAAAGDTPCPPGQVTWRLPMNSTHVSVFSPIAAGAVDVTSSDGE